MPIMRVFMKTMHKFYIDEKFTIYRKLNIMWKDVKMNPKQKNIAFLVVLLFIPSVFYLNTTSISSTEEISVIKPADTPLKVVVSSALLEDFVVNVAGDLVSVEATLVEGNEDPHTYEPVPSDITALVTADLFFYTGRIEIDPWWSNWEASIEEDNPDLGVVPVINDSMVEVDPLTEEENLHVWMDPHNAKAMVNNIYLGIKTAIVEDSLDTLNEMHESYQMELDQLISEIEGNRTVFEGTKIVVHHPSMMYFFDLLGIRREAAIEEDHDVEPSAQHIQEVTDLMLTDEITLIAHQANLDEDEIMQIARDTDSKIIWCAPLIGMTGADGAILETYVNLIRYNLWALQNPTDPTEEQKIPGYTFVLLSFSILVSIGSLLIIQNRRK